MTFRLVLLLACCAAAVLPPVQAQPAPTLRELRMDAKQQAALGVHTSRLNPSQGGLWLASATVTTPPGKDISVTAPYAGQLSRVLVGLGDSVRIGTSLGLFTSPMLGEARRQWREASLEAQNTQAALQRDQALLEEGIIPAVRLQLSRNKHEAAQAALQSSAAELAASGLRFAGPDANNGYATGVLQSPISGVVIDTFTSVGQRVEAGTVLFKLADTRQLQLDIQLSGDKAARLKVGDTVSIPSRQAQAKITGVSLSLDAGQSAKARALVTQRGELRIGEGVSVQLLTGMMNGKGSTPVSGSTWTVPARALSQWQNQSIIFVANALGFTAQPVRLLSSNDDSAIVEVQLPANSQLAITGIASLRALLQKDE